MTRRQQPALREMMLDEPRVALLDREHALIALRDTSGDLQLTIPAAAPDALALEATSGAGLPLWPFAIDLLARTLAALGVRLDRVVVEHLVDDLTLGSLDLSRKHEKYVVKARVADAVLLGLRLGAPVFATEELLQPAIAD